MDERRVVPDFTRQFLRNGDNSRQAAALDIFFSTVDLVFHEGSPREQWQANILKCLFAENRAVIGMDINYGAISTGLVRAWNGDVLVVNVPTSFFNVVTGLNGREPEEVSAEAKFLLGKVFRAAEDFGVRIGMFPDRSAEWQVD